MQPGVKTLYAGLYVDSPIDLLLTYRIPAGMKVMPGMRVAVGLGSYSKEVTGWVVEVSDSIPAGDFEIKDIIRPIDEAPIFDRRLASLCLEIASYYVSTPEEVFSAAIPSGTAAVRKKSPRAQVEQVEHPLTDEQSSICEKILSLKQQGVSGHLIHGVTGSGKTDIYIELARRVIAVGSSVIYLVPEISLSSQIFSRLEAAFSGSLVIYHSGLSAAERFSAWTRFYSGDARVAIGTRSAVFMQCPSPGLIIIDEEHDPSYKENSSPRYNARRVALMRSAADGTLVVMGSATPSIESYYAAERGVLALHVIKNRYGGAAMPSVEIAQIESAHPKKILSTALKFHTMNALRAGNQAVFLLNRRGFAPFVMCGACGWRAECGDCGIPLNFHRDGFLVCHYCGNRDPIPEKCPKCGSDKIEKIGSGTQRIEDTLVSSFSGYSVARLDRDTSRRKGMVEDFVSGMNSKKIDLVIGTQLVAKGFDFPGVTVVGIILAEIGLNMPDFRASERIFSLLTQAAGRAGRGSDPGRVIIQALDSGNPLFEFVKNGDYEGFYRNEISTRRAAGYPPFMRLVRLLVRGRDELKTIERAALVKKKLSEAADEQKIDAVILGPSAAPLAKIGNNYRHHILVKIKNPSPLREILRSLKKEFSRKDLYLEIDVDPFDIM